jgi:hypothetical protein
MQSDYARTQPLRESDRPSRSQFIAAWRGRDCISEAVTDKLTIATEPRRELHVNPTPQIPADGIRDANDIAAPIDPILLRIFNYWESKRGSRLMPSRADIDPAELRSLVYNLMLYDVVEPGKTYRVRLVGQAIVDFVGKNNTGQLATASMPPEAAKRMIEILTSVVVNRGPRFRAGYAYWQKDKSYRKFEACFLPLSPDDQTVDMILAGNTFATNT